MSVKGRKRDGEKNVTHRKAMYIHTQQSTLHNSFSNIKQMRLSLVQFYWWWSWWFFLYNSFFCRVYIATQQCIFSIYYWSHSELQFVSICHLSLPWCLGTHLVRRRKNFSHTHVHAFIPIVVCMCVYMYMMKMSGLEYF